MEVPRPSFRRLGRVGGGWIFAGLPYTAYPTLPTLHLTCRPTLDLIPDMCRVKDLVAYPTLRPVPYSTTELNSPAKRILLLNYSRPLVKL
jgi:hypothetical protein